MDPGFSHSGIPLKDGDTKPKLSSCDYAISTEIAQGFPPHQPQRKDFIQRQQLPPTFLVPRSTWKTGLQCLCRVPLGKLFLPVSPVTADTDCHTQQQLIFGCVTSAVLKVTLSRSLSVRLSCTDGFPQGGKVLKYA